MARLLRYRRNPNSSAWLVLRSGSQRLLLPALSLVPFDPMPCVSRTAACTTNDSALFVQSARVGHPLEAFASEIAGARGAAIERTVPECQSHPNRTNRAINTRRRQGSNSTWQMRRAGAGRHIDYGRRH